jgi:tetratricopeptide (TPR) repeat protein
MGAKAADLDRPPPRPAIRDDFLALAAGIFLVSLTVRLVHLFQIRRAPFFDLLMGDAQSYHAWAQRIAAGDWIGHEVFYQAPLYPYFLALIYALFGEAPLTVRLCQAVVGSLACVSLAIAASRLFSRPAGIAAGVMLAFYAPAIFFDGLIQKSVLDAFLLCLALALLSRLVVHPTHRWLWLWVGVTLGAITLSRENAVVFVAAILVWLFWWQSHLARQRLVLAGFLLGGVAFVLLPVAARNKIVSGEFHLTTSQFGPNFYIGNNEHASGTYQPLRFGHGDPKYERQDAREIAEQSLGRPLTPAEVSRYWTGRTLEYIGAQPLGWLGLMGRKIMLAWNAAEVADTEDQVSYADWSVVLRVAGAVWHFGVLAPLALLGMWVAWPRRSELALLYLLPAAYFLALIAFAVMARYRYPLVPFLILFAAAGIANVGQLLRATPRSLVSGLAAAILFAVFCNWPVHSMAEMRAITESNVGTELQAQGKVDEAIALYRAALARDPKDAVTRSNLGTALAAKGQLDEAIVQYRTALDLVPTDADTRYNLGNALTTQGKLAAAADQFREALRIEPTFADAHLNLGNALVALGQTEEAADHYRRAADLEPGAVEAVNNLGQILSAQGRLEEATAMFRRALSINPDFADAHNDLGIVLAQQNQLDEAIGHFRQAIKLAPEHAEAHGNLGMALQVDGKREEAIRHYQEAIRLSPGNPEMERRLRALLAAR